jgi:hypothetical protein
MRDCLSRLCGKSPLGSSKNNQPGVDFAAYEAGLTPETRETGAVGQLDGKISMPEPDVDARAAQNDR